MKKIENEFFLYARYFKNKNFQYVKKFEKKNFIPKILKTQNLYYVK